MIGYPAHWGSLLLANILAGQRNLQLSGAYMSVLKKHLIKIT
jgi:hypothetical protein